jgi:neutral ceramidase
MHEPRTSRRPGPRRSALFAALRWAAVATLGLAPAWVSPNTRAGAAEPPRAFRAGAATSNISPWLGLSINGNMRDVKAAHVHDELHARAVVLDDGATRLAIVACDSCMIPREVVTDAKRRIRERSGLDPSRVLISATHAHSAPAAAPVFQSDPDADYRRFLALKIADAVQGAVTNLGPARVGWGVGKNDRLVFNRRWKMKPGTIPPDPFGRTTDQVKMNPPPGSPNLVEPAGPIDPEVWVVSVQGTDGRPIALLANYALHYVGGVGPGHASADYFGAFADRVRERLGAAGLDPPFVAMMTNGTSGDINNTDFRSPRQPARPYEKIRRVADELAGEAVRVAGTIEHRDATTLDAIAVDVELGVRLPSPEDVARAEAIVARAKGPEMTTVEEIYARETMLLSQYPKTVPVTLQALRIGGLGIVAIPCEVFSEIGLRIKAESPFRSTFTIELANGYNGYLPTEAQHALGGYETWRARSSYLEVDAARKVSEKVLDLLRQLKTTAGEP